MEKIWLKRYPKGVPSEIDLSQYLSVVDVLDKGCERFRHKKAFTNLGKSLTFDDLDRLSTAFAAFLQNEAGLKRGDRIALQMPNILQFPIALFGALRAGLTVVNTNPLYTPREMEHQFKDSGAKAIVILANFADKLEKVIAQTSIETVVITELGDMLDFPKRAIVNAVVKHVKKMVPKYDLPQAFSFLDALEAGRKQIYKPIDLKHEDIAFLQYTGGTTGVAKGAMLTHQNIVANLLQIAAWMKPRLKEGEEVVITPLPLYHIFSLTVNCLAFMSYGGENILITNPRDFGAFIKELRKVKFTAFTGLNTLFNALMNHSEFKSIDFSHLKVVVGGGMAMQKSVTERWKKLTGVAIAEGYGLTEASPVLCCNPIDGTDQVGTIGIPVPSTEIRICDESGQEVAMGEAGELWARGPQVMKGYWNRPEETANVLTSDGWLKTGDVAMVQEDGYFRIVDRKKDMIIVSGFNVFPNEIEEVLAGHPGVLEAAAIGVPDEHSGEAVKVFIVKKDPALTEAEVRAYAKQNLTNYKIPRHVEFRTELPKTPVGKILRKDLRPSEAR